jgi:acetate kinase
VRKLICQGLDHLGIRFDARANEAEKTREMTISSADSDVRVMVIPTNEEEAIAGDAFALTAGVTESA